MSAPWKKDKTTLEKVEERFFDIVDQLKLDERAAELKTQLKDLKLDEKAAEIRDQIAASDAFNDLKGASNERLDDLRSRVASTAEPTKKSHKGRKVLLLAVVGAGAAAIAFARKKSSSHPQPAPFSRPESYPTQPPPAKVAGDPIAGAHSDKS